MKDWWRERSGWAGFKTKEQAVKTAVAEFIQRRQRRLILNLSGKIQFDPDWDYKEMRSGSLVSVIVDTCVWSQFLRRNRIQTNPIVVEV